MPILFTSLLVALCRLWRCARLDRSRGVACRCGRKPTPLRHWGRVCSLLSGRQKKGGCMKEKMSGWNKAMTWFDICSDLLRIHSFRRELLLWDLTKKWLQKDNNYYYLPLNDTGAVLFFMFLPPGGNASLRGSPADSEASEARWEAEGWGHGSAPRLDSGIEWHRTLLWELFAGFALSEKCWRPVSGEITESFRLKNSTHFLVH